MPLAPWQRSAIRFLTVVAVALSGCGTVFYFAVVDRDYFKTSLHSDTAIRPVPNNTGMFVFVEQPGRITLVFDRGEHESPFMTDSGWRETVVVEFPQPKEGQRIELEGPDVRVSYRKFQPFTPVQVIGSGGVRGHIEVLSCRPDRLAARYEFFVDVYSQDLAPDVQHRDVMFRGRSTFAAEPRPTERQRGDVWPKP